MTGTADFMSPLEYSRVIRSAFESVQRSFVCDDHWDRGCIGRI